MQVHVPANTVDLREASAPWSAVCAMSLCAFVLVASEFMPVSLLTPLASELGLTEGQAGQAISISGIFAVATSLGISWVTRRLDRKRVLLSLTALMIVSGALVALAPSYALLMLGRALLGIAIGGCWSMSTAVLIRIVPKASVPKAIAILQGGSAFASTVAAPLGAFIGSLIGWRGAFFSVVPLAAMALIWQAMTLPALPSERKRGTGNVLLLLAQPKIAVGMTAVALLFMGQFTLFTYLRPFLETVTRVDVSTLSLILLGIGVAGLVGTMAIGELIERHLYATVIAIPLLMVVIAVGLVVFGGWVVGAAVLLGAWGLLATPAPVGWFTWLSLSLPEDAEAGGGLMVAVIQLAITLGATVGGLLYDAAGYEVTFGLSAGILALAAALAILTGRTAPAS
ncbi:MFS transporter [Bosea vaviloviae]|uniref:Transcriptional regulator n=1 Tax=Bosea vaviloviae TaxID=1526658 RepID=A0A1D7U617_9HYPH|nr:MFS transporter [Bosea vaviloviae]AOO82829.1 transcriptional regulator [Bosea vaviloviae]